MAKVSFSVMAEHGPLAFGITFSLAMLGFFGLMTLIYLAVEHPDLFDLLWRFLWGVIKRVLGIG